VFIPPHLRVLHLSSHECLVNDTLLQNLLLYAPIERVHGGTERVRQICKLLGITDQILDHLDKGTKMKDWASMLSHTDYARLNLARALIMNPECLVLHKPDMVFSLEEVETIMTLIRRHVNERGLELSERSRSVRRPRTVFFTATTMHGVNVADRVFEVRKEGHGHRTNPLQVKILSGRDLPNMDVPGITGKSDPYCLCQLVGKPRTRLTTETMSDNLNPVWNFSGDIPFFVHSDVLKFAVYDADEMKHDDLLGEAVLPLKDLDTTGFTGELQLTKDGKGSKAHIKVEVKPRLDHVIESVASAIRTVTAAEVREHAGELQTKKK